ncbi:hypothetical protein BDR22DRAFT_883689 [Usnea florida]
MPLKTTPMPCSRKRQLCVQVKPTTDPSPSIAKRPKLEKQRRHRTASWFWDNLSRQFLCPRALREFGRRTEWPATPSRPDRTGKKDIDLAQLKRFARHGGPSLEILRAAICRTQNRRSFQSNDTPKYSAYDPCFERHLIDHGIYPHRYRYDDDHGSKNPDNLGEMKEMLAQPQPSLPPLRLTQENFERFVETDERALNEDTMLSEVFAIIAGPSDVPSQKNLLFNNLKDLTDGSLTEAKPDFYDGSPPADLNMQIRKELGPYIVKGPDGRSAVCKRQALYDGTLGARGMYELRSYVDPETTHDKMAYTITATYFGETLTIYSTHTIPSNNPKNPVEYHMTKLNAWAMTGNPEAFRQGAIALRNARDWAKEKRKELIDAANEKVLDAEHSVLGTSTQSFVSLTSKEVTRTESDTSSDELA